MYVENSRLVSSVRVTTSDPYFPFLERLNPLKGALPLGHDHMTRVCEGCFSSAYQQWIAYERSCTPVSARVYKIKDKYFSDSPLHPADTENKTPRMRAEEVCYLCGQMKAQNQILPLYTVPPPDKRMMYFTFIRELRRPHGAQPLNPDGTVLVCVSCNGNLKTQWDHYERESVPPIYRRYSLLPLNPAPLPAPLPPGGAHPASNGRHSEPKSGLPRIESPRVAQQPKLTEKNADGADMMQPLNIQISRSPVLASGNTHGLLAIAPHTPRGVAADDTTSSVSEMAASGLISKNSDLPRGAGSISNGPAVPVQGSVPHPLAQAAVMPKKVCFLCGEQMLLGKSYVLLSYPPRHENKSSAVPYFPFLANREPAPGALPMGEDGTVVTCNYCYYSLISQWKEFEESKNPANRNRGLRRYNVKKYVCYICGQVCSRRRVRTLEARKYHFLKDHKPPPGALIMDGGEAVSTCDLCTFSLTHQLAEYDRMGVPPELRKYNWTTVPMAEDSSQENSGDQVSLVHTQTPTHMYTHPHTNTCTHTHTPKRIHAHTHTHTHAHTHT
jgi:hypothetical protein